MISGKFVLWCDCVLLLMVRDQLVCTSLWLKNSDTRDSGRGLRAIHPVIFSSHALLTGHARTDNQSLSTWQERHDMSHDDNTIV